MLRYVTITWNVFESKAASAAAQIRDRVSRSMSHATVLDLDVGLVAIYSEPQSGSSTAYVLPDRRGIVFGNLFPAIDDLSCALIRPEDSTNRDFLDRDGSAISDRYWGRYVAFLSSRPTSSVFVLRDPSGGIPCYWTSRDGVNLFFSDCEDLVSFGLPEPNINWLYVHACLLRPIVESVDTGLENVWLVRQGERIALRAGKEPCRELFWNPLRIAESDPIEDVGAAVSESRRMVQACVGAWASCSRRIVHRYSGGLDSTVVLACLQQASSHPTVACLSYADTTVDAGERAYIRRAAETASAGAPLEFLQYSRDFGHTTWESLSGLRRFAQRPNYLNRLLYSPRDAEVARVRQATLFDGNLGDQIFYSSTYESAIDYVFQHGAGRPLLSIARGIAPRDHLRRSRILLSALWGGLLKRDTSVHATPSRVPFVPPQVQSELQAVATKYATPFWLNGASEELAPGKRAQIGWLCWPSSRLNPFAHPGDPEEIIPLASQPLFDLFLRIPSYVLGVGGVNRAVIRRAFSERLPPELLGQGAFRGLDTPVNAHALFFRQHRAQAREFLLDGLLVERGLLDRRELESFFDEPKDGDSTWAAVLLGMHFDLEVWLRSWTDLRSNSRGHISNYA